MNLNYYRNVKLETLEQQFEKGWLRKSESSDGKLVQYNYSNKTQYEKHWNRHTKNNRGHIYEKETGKLIAMAFPKFFNYSELTPSEQGNVFNQQWYCVSEKMDGCLGICYFYDGKWRVNSRGSFNSFASRIAEELLKKYPKIKYLNRNWTLLFEIIHPKTKIIIDYGGSEELCLIGGFSVDPVVEISESQLDEFSSIIGFSRPRRYNHTINQIFNLQKTMPCSEEGFVVQFKHGWRVKFKGEEYFKIARILSNMTPKNFWKTMEDGMVGSEFLADIPEEFRNESDTMVRELEQDYIVIKEEIVYDYIELMKGISKHYNWGIRLNPIMNKFGDDISTEDCKKVGIALQSYCSGLKHGSAIFPYIKRSGIDKYIMKYIKPKGGDNGG